jgi:hypothetical protein
VARLSNKKTAHLPRHARSFESNGWHKLKNTNPCKTPSKQHSFGGTVPRYVRERLKDIRYKNGFYLKETVLVRKCQEVNAAGSAEVRIALLLRSAELLRRIRKLEISISQDPGARWKKAAPSPAQRRRAQTGTSRSREASNSSGIPAAPAGRDSSSPGKSLFDRPVKRNRQQRRLQ